MPDKKKILIIEDEPALLRALEDKLEHDGFVVVGAETGEEGVEKIKQEKPNLVLLDLMLPGMSGEEVLKKSREIKKFTDLPIIVMSAKSDDATVSHCLNNLGANDYLVKSNFTLEELVEKVRKNLQ